VSYTQQLHQLQQIDTQIMDVRKRLEEISANLVESEALRSARSTFRQAEQELKQVKTLVKSLELEVAGLQQKITANEKRLYSGKVTNPKEAGSLQDEVASSKRWLTKREEDLLEAMIDSENVEEVHEQAQVRLTDIKVTWEATQADLLQEQAKCQNKLQSLINTRTALVQLLDKRDLNDYERLREKLSGVGLAEVENDICTACGVMLSSRLIQQARADNRLHYCEVCGRILHVL
jgi:predicted  nucleic acid-binding Zn-ribbon protein